MKGPRHSFRNRLLVCFLVVSLVPLLLCSILLVQISQLRMTSQTRQDLQELSSNLNQSLDIISTGFAEAARQLRQDNVVTQALFGNGGEDTQVNRKLFLATDPIRDYATILIYDMEGTPRYSTENTYELAVLPENWGILYEAVQAGGEPVYVACQNQPDETDPLLWGAVLLKAEDGTSLGYLVMEMRQKDLSALLEGKYGPQGSLLILSPYWHPVYASHRTLFTSLAPQLRETLMSGYMPGQDTEDHMYEITHHEATGLYLVLQQPQTFNRSTTKMLYAASLSCALICVIISITMCLPLSQQIFSPIQRLQHAFSKLERDDLSVQLSISREDELGELAKEFNHMVQALKLNRDELVRNQRELNEAQIRMLQAQLNPHFLCNTLDTMKWISKINNVPQVALMSTNLADILRFCISPDEFVPLYREVEVLERYIEIQKIRLSDGFTFRVALPEELVDCMVPKMILQPIVENSILHGLNGVKDSQILVEAEQTEDHMLRITVTDNGLGLPPDMVGKPYSREKALTGNHLGLYNVNTILSKHYGNGCGLYLDKGPGGTGTAVTATLPIRMEEDPLC